MAGGFRAAVELLRGLDLKDRERILKEMARGDPALVEELRHNFITLEDFKDLTPLMLHELIKTATPERMATALRLAPPALQEQLLNNTTKTLRATLEEILHGPPLPVAQVQKAYQELMDICEQMAQEGKIIINPQGKDQLV